MSSCRNFCGNVLSSFLCIASDGLLTLRISFPCFEKIIIYETSTIFFKWDVARKVSLAFRFWL